MGYKGNVVGIHRSTVSGHVDSGEGVVYWILLTVSSGDGTLRLRDGPDDSGTIRATIKLDAGSPPMVRFDPPLPYYTGLYADCVDHIQDYTIAFDHLEE